jgi:predicted nucleic acid-binding protein
MERIGLDTGFFLKIMEENETALKIWEEIIKGNIQSFVSVLVIFELKRLFHKREKIRLWDDFYDAIKSTSIITSLTEEVALSAASLSHGTGLPAVDSLIYTSYLKQNISKFYTTDSDFEVISREKPEIIFL